MCLAEKETGRERLRMELCEFVGWGNQLGQSWVCAPQASTAAAPTSPSYRRPPHLSPVTRKPLGFQI